MQVNKGNNKNRRKSTIHAILSVSQMIGESLPDGLKLHEKDYISLHPPVAIRYFVSPAVEKQIRNCITMLVTTGIDAGFMHESFHKYDAIIYGCPWFAWTNSFFPELIIKTSLSIPNCCEKCILTPSNQKYQ